MNTSRLRDQLLDRTEFEIFHAAKQDLEALFAVYERLPRSIFDTQIAAGLLGFPPQIGYAGLVRQLLGLELPKDQTRTDWSRRPLTDAQLHYALEDVAHLHQLFDIVRDRLLGLGRFEWAIEDSRAMLDPTLYAVPPDAAWRRLSGVPYLPAAPQARVRRLAGWREDRARTIDRPRQWVLADKALLAIAHENPTAPGQLSQIDGVPPALARKHGKAIIDVIREANADVDSGRLKLEQRPIPPAPDKGRVKHLSGLVRQAADRLGIAPEILATRRDISGILNGRHDSRVLSGWRREVIGERLLEAA
jgi:ribonuclease D